MEESIGAARVRRQRESGVAGSLLSAPAAAALAAADLAPAGEVMGCIVMHLGWSGFGCGGFVTVNDRNPNLITPVRTSGQNGGRDWRGYGPYVRARYHAYDTAVSRMLTEAAALQADGVVGVDLKWSHLDSGARELVALGTAVRNRQPERRRPAASRPFCTELSGEDVAKAMLAGWTPLGITVGLSIAVKHEDASLQWQTRRLGGPGNVEVAGLTNLVQAARAEARNTLAERATRFPAAAQVVISGRELKISTAPCYQEKDHVAEALFIGTALAYDPGRARSRSTSSLSILPLKIPGEGSR